MSGKAEEDSVGNPARVRAASLIEAYVLVLLEEAIVRRCAIEPFGTHGKDRNATGDCPSDFLIAPLALVKSVKDECSHEVA